MTDLTTAGERSGLIKLIVGAALIEFLGLVVATVGAGGGHGTYHAAKIFFPFAMAVTGLTGSITALVLAMALLQFPFYALMLWSARHRPGRWVVLLGCHGIAVVFAYLFASNAFNP